jgi:tRNA nucleotidyltransferase (CCA-adding enzyme)
MSREHVDHADIVRFADERVNLKQADVKEHREQANRLRDRLDVFLKEHPDFALKKMLLSGSLAKGTALKSLNDIDVACYVASSTAPEKIGELVVWLAEKLRNAFPNMQPDQVKPQTYSVTVSFRGSGLDVDVVPILYDGDQQWRGFLVSQETGAKLMTSIPMHLDFIRKRKAANPKNFAQVVRLIKHWAKIRKAEDQGFRFKSFMIEMMVAHLADKGVPLADYPSAMSAFFNFIASDEFKTTIKFADFYNPNVCPDGDSPIRIWDPVNHVNNVASLYDASNKSKLIDAAEDAGDAIAAALRAVTKGETVRHWQRVLGPSFDA